MKLPSKRSSRSQRAGMPTRNSPLMFGRGQGVQRNLDIALDWFGLRFCTTPRGAAFAYKAAVAGAGGQEPLLALGPISTTRCCRTAMAYLNVCRFAVGSMTRVVGSAFQRSDGGLLCLVHPRP